MKRELSAHGVGQGRGVHGGGRQEHAVLSLSPSPSMSAGYSVPTCSFLMNWRVVLKLVFFVNGSHEPARRIGRSRGPSSHTRLRNAGLGSCAAARLT